MEYQATGDAKRRRLIACLSRCDSCSQHISLTTLLASPAIYVELARRQRPWMLMERFASVTRLGNLVRSDRGVPIATYAVYLLADPIGSVLGPALRERDDSSW